MPIVHADTPAAVAEERRLFYVGVTRARRELLVSWAAARTPGGRASRGPTRFLDGVLDRRRVADGDTGRTRSGGRGAGHRKVRTVRSCRGCGRPLSGGRQATIGRCETCPATYDEQLFERLRDWRRAQSGAQRVPAYCVLTDATLVALAEELPGSTAALARIPGVGKAKLDRYGADLLALLGQR